MIYDNMQFVLALCFPPTEAWGNSYICVNSVADLKLIAPLENKKGDATRIVIGEQGTKHKTRLDAI